jgi:CRISPR/Cas system CSM-associated protein Csm4 (group 5 of RAMP superfamily)
MLADLELEESLKLQEAGLGPGRKLGCGLFLPQKGIKPVNPD